MSLLGGDTGSTSYQGSNSSNQTGPALGTPYLGFENQQLANIQGLTQQPFQPYDVNSMFAPLNATQNKAFGQVDQATSAWQPYFSNASGSLSQNGGAAYDPTKAAATAFGNAQSTPSALGTASPYASAASQPGYSNIQDYMNPYINNSVNAANQLQSSNFLNNVLPGINNQFVASGGGLGSPQYGNTANMALTNFNQNIGNTTQGALASGYNSAMTASQTDLARQAGLAGTMGNLALGQQAGNTALGSAMGNNAALGANTNIANANAWSGLGTGYLNNSLLGANALLQTGNQQQQNAQNPLTAAYQQFQQQVQFPYQQAGWAANTANAYTWPMQSNTQANQSGGTNATSQGSLLGTGLGTAAAIGSIAGQASDLFGSNNSVGTVPSQVGGGQVGAQPVSSKRGGYFPGFARGGYFAMGGMPSNANEMMSSMSQSENAAQSNLRQQQQAASQKSSGSGIFGSLLGALGGAAGTYFGGPIGGMIGSKLGSTIGSQLKRGGYLSINRDSIPPAMQPAFKDYYAKGGYLSINRDTMPPAAAPYPNNDNGPQIGYARGGYLDIDRTTMPGMLYPQGYSDNGLQVGYAEGGPADNVEDFNAYRRLRTGRAFEPGVRLPMTPYSIEQGLKSAPNVTQFTKRYADGGYLDLNHASDAAAMQPAFRDYYKKGGYFKFAAGGVAPVIKTMRAATKRSIAAAQAKEKAEQLKAQMARPNLPLDLSPRSGHFSQ